MSVYVANKNTHCLKNKDCIQYLFQLNSENVLNLTRNSLQPQVPVNSSKADNKMSQFLFFFITTLPNNVNGY